MYLAVKEMKKNKGRFAMIIAIILLISYLVFFLSALADGLSNDKVSAINLWDSQYVVLEKDANKNIMQSQVPLEEQEQFKAGDPQPLAIMRQSAFINEQKSVDDLKNIVVMGMPTDSTIFPELIDGTLPKNAEEVVITKDLVDEENMKIGDEIHLAKGDEVYHVTGITPAAKYGNTPVIYGNLDLTNQLTHQSNNVNAFVLMNQEKPANDVDYQVLGMKEFIQKLPGYKAEQMTFTMMISFLIVISAIILGVFIFIMTLQKKTTFGIMKIQGISSSYIGKSVMMQTLVTAIIGVLSGMILTLVTGMALPVAVPFKANPLNFAVMAVIMVVISLAGALFSMRNVAKIDPIKTLG
ncbi:putative ABC transport system permease protein [Granulicatella balaenopterae]|uniref:Putative hemin transport system permease protein HrtB n=1 Tax=Granulicatella balaenopterae TaxID=137733 RepID=A0A1H9PDM3_9LACT|nr:ABC transporter permease [Granulicatella balaenopterae]SER46290.1 putative ABC transport system permease protein [Granulicatella balaenopterae]